MSDPAPLHTPILRGMHPDPSLCLVDGTYYLATSTFEYLPGIPIYTSSDLSDWRLSGHAVHDPAQFDFSEVGDSRGMFAPTIRHHDGVFYVACTFVVGDELRNFYVTATDVGGPWSEPVLLPEAAGIDPSLFFHEGRVWWVGCRPVPDPEFEGETEIWLRELDLAAGRLIGPETVIWQRTQFRAVWAEGPHLYQHDGWFYLLTAEGGTAEDHAVMVARSREIAGPYLPCPRNPILTHRHLGQTAPVQCVGHAEMFEGRSGEWWMVMLATRPVDGCTILGRETHLARVEWEDGWPVVNPGRGVLDPPVAAPGAWGSAARVDVSDFMSVRGFPDFARDDGDQLVLRSTGHGFASGHRVAGLLRRLSSVDSTVAVEWSDIDATAVVGLCLRQSDEFTVRLELAHGTARLIDRGRAIAERQYAPPSSGRSIRLSAEVSVAGVTWTVGDHALGTTPLASLSTEEAAGFVGTTFGPYVTGPAGAGARFTAWSQIDRS